MKKIILSLLFIVIFTFISCYVRVLKKDENSAILQANHKTKVEAKIKAEEKAKELFGKFVIVKEDCSQEFKGSGSTDSSGEYSASAQTYWSCTYHVKKMK